MKMPRRLVVSAFSFLLVLALTLPVAAKPIKASFRIFEPVSLAGTQLEPGDYRLVAEDSTVTIFRGNEKILETAATWVDGEKRRETSVVTNGHEVREIRIRGKEGHLKIGK